MDIASWNGHRFTVSYALLRGMSGLEIKAGAKTDTKKSDGNEYVTRKNGNPMEVKLTMHLNALLGCSPREEAMALADEAQKGAKAYFYVGERKLLPCQLMLTDATVKEIQMTAAAQWVSCDVEATLKQADKAGGAADDGKKKRSVRAGGVAGGKAATWYERAAETVAGAIGTVKKAKVMTEAEKRAARTEVRAAVASTKRAQQASRAAKKSAANAAAAATAGLKKKAPMSGAQIIGPGKVTRADTQR